MLPRGGEVSANEFAPGHARAHPAIAFTLALVIQACVFLILAPGPTGVTISADHAHEVDIEILHAAPPSRARTDLRPSRPLHSLRRRTALVPPAPTRGAASQVVHSESNLQGLARALFGCEPGTTPLSARKARPCSGIALYARAGSALGSYHSRPQAKHALRWALALAQERSPLLLPGALLAPLFYLGSVVSRSIMDKNSLARDPARWPTYLTPGRFLPRSQPADAPIPAKQAQSRSMAPAPPPPNAGASQHFNTDHGH